MHLGLLADRNEMTFLSIPLHKIRDQPFSILAKWMRRVKLRLASSCTGGTVI
jgi:hypothetical protein